MNIFFLSLLIGALSLPIDKLPETDVPMAKTEAKAPIVAKPDLSHLSMLEKFKRDPKYFVSQMSEADPGTLRTILGLLNDMLTTSEDRELHLHGNWDTAQEELDVANADVIEAEGVLSGAQQDQANADIALAAADADLGAKRDVQSGAQTEKNDAQTAYDDAIPSLDDEQAVLQNVISILTELLDKQPDIGSCTDPADFTTGDGSGGTEQFLGWVSSIQECLDLIAAANVPNGNGITVHPSVLDGENGRCYVEIGVTGHNGNDAWRTCAFDFDINA